MIFFSIRNRRNITGIFQISLLSVLMMIISRSYRQKRAILSFWGKGQGSRSAGSLLRSCAPAAVATSLIFPIHFRLYAERAFRWEAIHTAFCLFSPKSRSFFFAKASNMSLQTYNFTIFWCCKQTSQETKLCNAPAVSLLLDFPNSSWSFSEPFQRYWLILEDRDVGSIQKRRHIHSGAPS